MHDDDYWVVRVRELEAALRELLETHSMTGSVGLKASQQRLAAKKRARELLGEDLPVSQRLR